MTVAPPQLPVVVENALVARERILPPHLERILMDPVAQPQDVNGAIVAGFGRFGAFLQNFEAQAQEEAQRVGGQVRALIEEQNALQRRLDQEGPNNAALRESLNQVNQRLMGFINAIPAPRVGELDRRINQLEMDQLRQRLTVLEQPAPRAANQPDPLAQLLQRVAALEQPAPRAANPPNQPDPLAQLLQRVAALEQPAPAAAVPAPNQPAPNPPAAIPAPKQPAPTPPPAAVQAPNPPAPNPALARLERLEAAENARRRERENQERQDHISRIRQRLLINVSICERAAIAAGVLLVPSIAGDALSGGLLMGKVAGYISKYGAKKCLTKACGQYTLVPNPFPVATLVTFAAFTTATIVSGIVADDKSTQLEKSRDLLNGFDRHIKSGADPEVALRNAQIEVNSKYKS